MRKIVFWCALLTGVVLSLVPGPMVPSGIQFWDKAQHSLGFFGLTGLCLLAYPRKTFLHIGWAMLLLGGFIEVAQWTTGWREGDWLDLMADAVGIACALGLWLVWLKIRPASALRT